MATIIKKNPASKAGATLPLRRAAMAPTRRLTVSLPVATVQRVREAVASGAAPSQNDLAHKAIETELRRLRELEIAQAMQEAANDPLFMKDLEDTMRDWAELDADSLRFIDVVPDYGDESAEAST